LWIRAEAPEVTMRGYHGLPQKTAETIVDGWIRSGDIFKRDGAGHYYFMDRRKDALRRRGENISSFEVEAALNEYPDVFESAVVAAPSDLGEDEIKAVIVPREGRDIDLVALTQFMIDRVPFFMVPRYFQLATELPKTPTQKIQKHLLRNAPIDDAVWDREAAGIKVSRRN
jgi:crotonobetaine/carnitine-CoA ligase